MRKLKKTCVAVVSVCLSLCNLSDSAFAVPQNKWTKEEDQLLLGVIKLNIDSSKDHHIDWKSVSNKMINRNARQCRERYNNYLSQNLSKDDWSNDEDEKLLYEVKIKGKRWTEISRLFKGRTGINLKNRYNLLMRRMDKQICNSFDKVGMLPKPVNLTAANKIKSNECDATINLGEDDMWSKLREIPIDEFIFSDEI